MRLRGAERFEIMKTKLTAAALGFAVFLVVAGMSIAKEYGRGCSTDTECMAQCPADDAQCDGGPQS